MAIPLIGAAIAALAPMVKDVVMDVVKDVAMDIGKQFVDTIGKGIKDVASEVLGKGAKVIGDVIKNPLDALKDLGKKLIPPGFQQLMNLGQSVMQAATNILQKFLDKIGININININIGGAQGAQAGAAQASGRPDAHQQIINGANNMNPQSIQLEKPTQSMVDAQNALNAQNNTSSAGNTQSTGGASDAGKTDGKKTSENYTNTHAKQFAAGELNGADMERLQLRDPKGFQAMMKDMTAEDRGLAMQQMQQHLQSVNQMISMMTNMAQIQHDTTKAVINNLRV